MTNINNVPAGMEHWNGTVPNVPPVDLIGTVETIYGTGLPTGILICGIILVLLQLVMSFMYIRDALRAEQDYFRKTFMCLAVMHSFFAGVITSGLVMQS